MVAAAAVWVSLLSGEILVARVQRWLRVACLVAFVLLAGYLVELRVHRLLRCQTALSTTQAIEVLMAEKGFSPVMPQASDRNGPWAAYYWALDNIAEFCT